MERIVKLCEGRGLKGGKPNRVLLWGLTATVWLSGCSGVLLEKYNQEGHMDRIRIDAVDWKKYDAQRFSPRDGRGMDDISIMLKSEKTF